MSSEGEKFECLQPPPTGPQLSLLQPKLFPSLRDTKSLSMPRLLRVAQAQCAISGWRKSQPLSGHLRHCWPLRASGCPRLGERCPDPAPTLSRVTHKVENHNPERGRDALLSPDNSPSISRAGPKCRPPTA